MDKMFEQLKQENEDLLLRTGCIQCQKENENNRLLCLVGRIKELCETPDLYRGRSALAKKIMDMIKDEFRSK